MLLLLSTAFAVTFKHTWQVYFTKSSSLIWPDHLLLCHLVGRKKKWSGHTGLKGQMIKMTHLNLSFYAWISQLWAYTWCSEMLLEKFVCRSLCVHAVHMYVCPYILIWAKLLNSKAAYIRAKLNEVCILNYCTGEFALRLFFLVV